MVTSKVLLLLTFRFLCKMTWHLSYTWTTMSVKAMCSSIFHRWRLPLGPADHLLSPYSHGHSCSNTWSLCSLESHPLLPPMNKQKQVLLRQSKTTKGPELRELRPLQLRFILHRRRAAQYAKEWLQLQWDLNISKAFISTQQSNCDFLIENINQIPILDKFTLISCFS